MRYKKEWNNKQRKEAERKVKILSDSQTTVTHSIQRNGKAQSRYRKDNNLPKNLDADHKIDLQLGGEDELYNIHSLDKSVNRSLGSQIKNKIKSFPDGAIVDKVEIND